MRVCELTSGEVYVLELIAHHAHVVGGGGGEGQEAGETDPLYPPMESHTPTHNQTHTRANTQPHTRLDHKSQNKKHKKHFRCIH